MRSGVCAPRTTAARKATGSAMTWSAGSSKASAPGFSVWVMRAAVTATAAVFRPNGSSTMASGCTPTSAS